jgi:hypothetical protein
MMQKEFQIDENTINTISKRCKDLVSGMHDRVDRDPDTADYKAMIMDVLGQPQTKLWRMRT